MAYRSVLLLGLLLLLEAGASSDALISSRTSPGRAISDLRDSIVRALGLQAEGVEVSGFDARDAQVGHALAYEFDIEIDKKVIPIKLLEDVSRWEAADLPTFGEGAEKEGDGAELVNIKWGSNSRAPPTLPPFQLAGPLELWIQDADSMRISLPHDVEAGTLRKVILADGVAVTLKGARSVSLRLPLQLPLPLNRTHPNSRRPASGLLAIAEAARHAARSSGEPLLSLRIVGPTSLTSSPLASPHDKLKLKRLAPGLVELDIAERIQFQRPRIRGAAGVVARAEGRGRRIVHAAESRGSSEKLHEDWIQNREADCGRGGGLVQLSGMENEAGEIHGSLRGSFSDRGEWKDHP